MNTIQFTDLYAWEIRPVCKNMFTVTERKDSEIEIPASLCRFVAICAHHQHVLLFSVLFRFNNSCAVAFSYRGCWSVLGSGIQSHSKCNLYQTAVVSRCGEQCDVIWQDATYQTSVAILDSASVTTPCTAVFLVTALSFHFLSTDSRKITSWDQITTLSQKFIWPIRAAYTSFDYTLWLYTAYTSNVCCSDFLMSL